MATDAQRKANRKYEKEKTENIRVRVPLGKKELVERCAATNHESINKMINRLLDIEIDQVLKNQTEQ